MCRLLMFGLATMMLASGCSMLSNDSIKEAIIQYAENSGKEKASDYIDQLAADGKLGSENAKKLKEALDKGIEKLKEELNKEVAE